MYLKINILILIIVFALVNAEYKYYNQYKVYKIIPKTEKDVEVLKKLENEIVYQFWSDITAVGKDVKIMVPPKNRSDFEEYIKSAGIQAKIVIEDVQKLIDAQLRRPDPKRINNLYNWDYYQSLEEIYKWMDDIVSQHPNVAEIVVIGNTFEGREIKGVKIDFKKRTSPATGILEGGIHAREWISPATMTWIINEFLMSEDPEIRALAENVVWHIFPVTNPDGYAYTFSKDRMWRKNRNTVSFTSCGTDNDDLSNGIDLNRNFGFRWMTVGASPNPCSQTYAGPTANSELETIAIINYVRSLQENSHLIYYFGFHSYSQLVLLPYGHLGGAQVLEVSNYGDLYEIAVRGTDKLKERNGTEYFVGTPKDILYETSGTSNDWARGKANIPIAYVIELRDRGEYGFLLPAEFIVDNNKETMAGLIEMDRVTRRLGYYTPHNSGTVLYVSVVLVTLTSILNMYLFLL